MWVSSNPAVATVSPTGLVTSVSLGSAVIYFVVSNVCGTDSAHRNITVGPNTVALISGPSVVCEGSTVTYTDPSPAGLWRTRTGPFGNIDSLTGVFRAGHIPGPDFIIYGPSHSCYRIDTIMIDSMPVIAPISGPTIVDSSWTITLTDPVTGGRWSSSDTTIAMVDSLSGVVTGMASGTVTITYSVKSGLGGCTADTTYTITVAPGTGVKNIAQGAAPVIYPNPATGLLHIGGIQGTTAVTITDVAGRTALATEVSAPAHLDISSLEPGIYFITVKTAALAQCFKLIKQ
jgi:hypothetical protein